MLMILKKIDEKTYEKFVSSSNLSSFYQSIEWYHLKLDEGKHCELLGLYEEDTLVGVSLIIYVKILRKYYYAYASRGFIYDYDNLEEFKNTLKKYFKGKVVFVKIDPPIILNLYDKSMDKEFNLENRQLIERLKYVEATVTTKVTAKIITATVAVDSFTGTPDRRTGRTGEA